MRLDWAIDAQIAGAEYHYATSAVEVDGVLYSPGLRDQALSRIVDFNASIGIEIATSEDWPYRFASAKWLVDGGPAALWLVIEEDDGSIRRVLWQRGTVVSVGVAERWKPLTFELRPSTRRGTIPDQRQRIDSYTAPSTDSTMPAAPNPPWRAYEDDVGSYYQVVFGYPGWDDVNAEPVPCVPCPVFQYAYDSYVYEDAGGGATISRNVPEAYLYLLGTGDISADQVYMNRSGITVSEDSNSGARQTQFSEDGVITTAGLYYGNDELGQRISFLWDDFTAPTYSSDYDPDDLSGNPAVYVAYSPAAPYGGGIQRDGKLLRDVSDVVEYVISAYTDLEMDLGAHRAQSQALGVYKIDTFANNPQDVLDWAQELVEPFAAAFVRSDIGIYLAHMPELVSSGIESNGSLVVGEGGVQFEGVAVSEWEDQANEITVRWGLMRDQSSFRHIRVITSEYRRVRSVPSGGSYYDTRAVPNSLCRRSQDALGEVRTATVDIPQTWALETALQVGADEAARRTFQRRFFQVSLPASWYALAPGRVLRFTYDELHLEDILCRVDDVVISAGGVTAVLVPLRGSDLFL